MTREKVNKNEKGAGYSRAAAANSRTRQYSASMKGKCNKPWMCGNGIEHNIIYIVCIPPWCHVRIVAVMRAGKNLIWLSNNVCSYG